MRDTCPILDDRQLDQILGGIDPKQQTTMVGHHRMTCGQVVAGGNWLVAHGDDPRISNRAWLRRWRRLDDAYMRFPKPC